jgi:hypothetical protein
MRPYVLAPEEVRPETIENIFRSYRIPVEEHKPFDTQDRRIHFVCSDDDLKIGVHVCSGLKLITFHAVIPRKLGAEKQFCLCPAISNELMKKYPMIRVVVGEDAVFFEYFLHSAKGVIPLGMVEAFRFFTGILREVFATLSRTIKDCHKIKTMHPESLKSTGMNYYIDDFLAERN